MADTTRENLYVDTTPRAGGSTGSVTRRLAEILALAAALLFAALSFVYQSAFIDTAAGESRILLLSTPGKLVTWMAEQSALEKPEAILGQVAKNWAAALGQETLDLGTALNTVRGLLVIYCGLLVILTAAGLVGLLRGARWTRQVLLAALLGADVLLFVIPSVSGESALGLLLLAIFLLLIILLLAPGKVSRFMGFMVVLSSLLLMWEAAKAFGEWANYQITLPASSWTYQPYETLDGALVALQNGEISAVIIDENDVEDLIAPHPNGDPTDTAYPELRILDGIKTTDTSAGFSVKPAFPGRLALVAQADNAANWESISQFVGLDVGTVAGSFAETNYLSQGRGLVLVDLKITNDLNMPHLQSMAEALLQPARRQGPVLLVRLLGAAALFTWGEAAVGFTAGALLGFLLGTLFAHSRLMTRGLLPYVVASQTVPILAIAPMVVIWLGAGPTAVAVISAYLTFFPVTINTLRGLTSPQPTALELMRSYAANKWTIMWKLRFPAALPYIFTALKVSATASVVGAIIGELPSGIRDGLGGAILNFNQYYSTDPAKLWAAIIIAALVGIIFFLLVTLLERLVLRGRVQAG